MRRDKYGVEQDSDCYPGTDVLINLLDLRDFEDLEDAERYLSAIAASTLEFVPPPYSLEPLRQIHYALFSKIYSWAGKPGRSLWHIERRSPVQGGQWAHSAYPF